MDDTIAGDQGIADEIEKLKKTVTKVAFASRGYSIDQPLAIAPRDIPNTFTDIAASTLLANLCTDAFRNATKADIGFTANGMMRAGFIKGKSGVQTVYDVFAVAPLGAGVLDTTAGSTLVTGYFTGQELKNMLEFFLVDNPAHPGEYFPRASGLQVPLRPVAPEVRRRDRHRNRRHRPRLPRDRHHRQRRAPVQRHVPAVCSPRSSWPSRNTPRASCRWWPRTRTASRSTSKVEALDDPRSDTPDLLPPAGTMDKASVATTTANGAVQRDQGMAGDHGSPAQPAGQDNGELPVIPVDERAKEVRAIKAG